MIQTQAKLVDARDKVVQYTFEYAVSSSWGKPTFRKSKKKWGSVKDAADAAGLWMYVCFENDFPVLVRVVEAD